LVNCLAALPFHQEKVVGVSQQQLSRASLLRTDRFR
jgi:hypothetical protein